MKPLLKIPDPKIQALRIALGILNDPKNKVALHVYSIYNLIHFVQKYPGLEAEIREVIMHNARGKTAAYKIAIRNFEKNIAHS